MIRELIIPTRGPGLYEITDEVNKAVASSKVEEGLCTVFIQHVSASLLLTENADPTATSDLERWFNRLVDENDPLFTHTLEGPDDMPSHIKGALTQSTLGIPIVRGKLALGTWQGVFVFEHRRSHRRRSVLLHIGV